MSVTAHILGYGPKYRAPGMPRLRETIARGASSASVTTRYGYDLSSLKRTLNGGFSSLIHVISRLRASTSLATTVHSTDAAVVTMRRGALVQGAQRREVVRQPRPEVLRLADVQDAPVGVAEPVHAGVGRDLPRPRPIGDGGAHPQLAATAGGAAASKISRRK